MFLKQNYSKSILGDLPALYSGTNAEFTKADSVIFRTGILYNFIL